MESHLAVDQCDVIILGSGLAGLSLARLLKRSLPEVNGLCLDAGSGPRRKVGESTVEIGAHFLHTRLGLADLLARTQLPKNGLRFWFDDEHNGLPFHEASEDGPATYSYWRSYQVERETLERSLLELNRQDGLRHLYGIRELEVTPAVGGELHTVRFEHEGTTHELRTRWLVDATGIASVLGRACDNLVREERIPHSACWTWFSDARALDDLIPPGSPAAKRFCQGPRLLSTNHLLNDGYWIWMIPLASGRMSVGLVYDSTVLRDPPSTQEELVVFLSRHRMLAEVLSEATAEDFGVLKRFSWRPRHGNLSRDRIAWVGTSGGFIDPFYSSGLDQIAFGCELTVAAIREDLVGRELNNDQIDLWNRSLLAFHEQTLAFFAGLYRTFVSQELSVVRLRRDTHLYWNLYAWPYLAGQAADVEYLRAAEPLRGEAIERTRFFGRLLEHCREQLAARGALRRNNRGRHTYNHLGYRQTPFVRFERQMGHAHDLPRARLALEEIDAASFLALLDVLFDGERSPLRGLLVEATRETFFTRRGFKDLLALERSEDGFTGIVWDIVFALLSANLRRRLEQPVQVTKDSWGRLLGELVDGAPSAEAARAVRRRFLAPPQLTDFEDLPPSQDATQPPASWTVDHTPWLEVPPDLRTIYDLRGAWWLTPEKGTP